MTILQLKKALSGMDAVHFHLPGGEQVPAHFHVTEVGLVQKKFIDCGGKLRQESKANLQLWNDGNVYHRLGAQKMLAILQLAQEKLGIADEAEAEVEYQMNTIGKFGLTASDSGFQLTSTHTACLANEACGAPAPSLQTTQVLTGDPSTICSPGSGCCQSF